MLLTKDNLTKRNWIGSKKCCFCNSEESIEHLFLKCPFAKMVWLIIKFTFDLAPPTNITNIFGNWLNGVDTKITARIRIDISDLYWAVWNY